MEENEKISWDRDKDKVGLLGFCLRQNYFCYTQERLHQDQLHRLHEDTEFTEEEFQNYKNEKVALAASLNSMSRSERSGR